jgi:GAF domain-containing protein
LQAMADQVAVALDNARLFAESECALEQTRAAYGEVSGRAWGELVRGREAMGYRYERGKVASADGPWRPEMIEVVQSGKRIVEGQDEAVVAVPLKVRDHTIGVVNLRRAVEKAWTQEEETLIEALAEQLGQTLESARLYQDTQQRAAREQMVAETTSRMREPLDLENVLQTAVEEMRRALDLDSLAVRLTIPETSGDGVSGGGQ